MTGRSNRRVWPISVASWFVSKDFVQQWRSVLTVHMCPYNSQVTKSLRFDIVLINCCFVYLCIIFFFIACLLACLFACLPARLLACLPACLPACLLVWPFSRFANKKCCFQSTFFWISYSVIFRTSHVKTRLVNLPWFSRGTICLGLLLPRTLLQWFYVPAVDIRNREDDKARLLICRRWVCCCENIQPKYRWGTAWEHRMQQQASSQRWRRTPCTVRLCTQRTQYKNPKLAQQSRSQRPKEYHWNINCARNLQPARNVDLWQCSRCDSSVQCCRNMTGGAMCPSALWGMTKRRTRSTTTITV